MPKSARTHSQSKTKVGRRNVLQSIVGGIVGVVTHQEDVTQELNIPESKSEPRPSASRRGYGRRWRKARKHFLKRNRLCVVHLAAGRTVEATEVDHIVPHKGDLKLFWDKKNWQSLCRPCHSAKTRKESSNKELV